MRLASMVVATVVASTALAGGKATPSTTMVARVSLVDGTSDVEPVTEVGAPATMRYEVENTGKTPVTLWHAAFWPNHRVVIEVTRGKLCGQGRCAGPELTKLGADGAAAFSPRGPRNKNVEWIVKPGGKDASEGSYDLGTLADLSAPGRYTVRVDYEEDIAFSSNTLAFWRVPKGARAVLDALQTKTGSAADHQAALARLGVDVALDPKTGRYRVTSVR